jgi:hypothetical protein
LVLSAVGRSTSTPRFLRTYVDVSITQRSLEQITLHPQLIALGAQIGQLRPLVCGQPGAFTASSAWPLTVAQRAGVHVDRPPTSAIRTVFVEHQ